MIPTDKAKAKVPQKLFSSHVGDFPAVGAEVREQLGAALIGMDDDVWEELSSDTVSSRSTVEAYLAQVGTDPSGAWAALCGEAVLHIRAKRQSATSDAAREGVEAELSEGFSPNGAKGFNDARSLGLPDADVLVRQACRVEDLIKAQTIALYAAWRAENGWWLHETRDHLLGGMLISVQDVTRFIESPAIGIFTRSELEENGIQSSRSFSRLTRSEPVEPHDPRAWKYGIYFEDYGVEMVRRIDPKMVTSFRGPPEDDIGEISSPIEDVPFLPGSLFQDLLTAADYLSSCLLRCGIGPALVFLLSGSAPASFPADADWLPGIASGGDSSWQSFGGTSWSGPSWKASHVSLTFPLWLSADVAEQAFRQVQKAILGAENRPFKEQYVRMFYFVLCERRRGIVGAGTEGERRQIWSSWNALCKQAGESGRHRIHMGVEAPEMPDPLSGLDPAWAIESFTYLGLSLHSTDFQGFSALLHDIGRYKSKRSKRKRKSYYFNSTCGRVEERLFPSFF